MTIKKNAFFYFVLLIASMAVMLMLIMSIGEIQKRFGQDYLTQALLVIGLFLAFGVMFMISRLLNLLLPDFHAPRHGKIGAVFTGVLLAVILGGGLLARIYVIRTYPVAFESDYKLYYDIATMLRDGTLKTAASNEYIALFPNTFGYSYILSLVMRVFGSNPMVCLYFNAVVSVLASLFVYGIGKRLAGPVCGVGAMLLSCYWPSQIIYANINGVESVFTFLLYGAIYLAVRVIMTYNENSIEIVPALLLHLAVGVLLGLASSVRPFALIFLIAMVISMVFLSKKLDSQRLKDSPFIYIFMSKGVLRAVVVVVGYLICTLICNAGVVKAIDKEIAGSGASGYSLMVGLDTESDGGYSEKSMNFLMDSYKKTGSASAAHKACLDAAIASVRAHPAQTAALLAKKASLLWSNDDYGVATNIVTMNNQKLLTPEREALLQQLYMVNNIYYLFVIFFAGIGLMYLFRKDNNAIILVLFFVGAFVLHLFLEQQNRYHYYLLQSLALLAAFGITTLGQKQTVYQQASRPVAVPASAPLASGVIDMSVPEPETVLEHGNHLQEVDIIQAIKDGHITVSVSSAYLQPSDKTTGKSNGDDVCKVKVRINS